MFSELGWFVFGIQDSQLCEHAHMCTFEAKRSLQQAHQLLEVAAILIVVDKIFKFISVHHNVQTTHLSQAELVVVHTGEANLFPCSGAGRKSWFSKESAIMSNFVSMYLFAFLALSTAP